MNPESPTAGKVYNAIKMLRFESEEVQDPFAKRFKGNVLEALMEDSGVMIKFIHYALRSDDEILSEYCSETETGVANSKVNSAHRLSCRWTDGR